MNEDEAIDGNSHVEAVREAIKDEDAELLIIAAGMEADIMELDTFEERQDFCKIGLDEPGVKKGHSFRIRFVESSNVFYRRCKRVRAWTIKEGFTAPQAAGVIHTDFEKGFIRVEVISMTIVALGSELACKEAGKLSIKERNTLSKMEMKHFRFNV